MAEKKSVDQDKLFNKKYYRTINVDVTLEDERNMAAAESNDMAEAKSKKFKATKQSKVKSVESDIDLMKLAKISHAPGLDAVKKKADDEEDAKEREENYKAMLKGMGFNVK